MRLLSMRLMLINCSACFSQANAQHAHKYRITNIMPKHQNNSFLFKLPIKLVLCKNLAWVPLRQVRENRVEHSMVRRHCWRVRKDKIHLTICCSSAFKCPPVCNHLPLSSSRLFRPVAIISCPYLRLPPGCISCLLSVRLSAHFICLLFSLC
jgi:hypothetical protein